MCAYFEAYLEGSGGLSKYTIGDKGVMQLLGGISTGAIL